MSTTEKGERPTTIGPAYGTPSRSGALLDRAIPAIGAGAILFLLGYTAGALIGRLA